MDWDLVVKIILAMLGLVALFIVINIILYLFQAAGLYKIAKREGHKEKAWLAWIPIVNSLLMTMLLEKAVHKNIRGNVTIIYGILLLVSFLFSSQFLIILIFPIAFFYYAFYFLAKRYSKKPVLHLVIAIITFGFTIGIQTFMFRKRKVVDATGL